MNRYNIIKGVKKLMGGLSLYSNECSGWEKRNNREITKTPNLKDTLFQELEVKQSQPEIKKVELPKYLFI